MVLSVMGAMVHLRGEVNFDCLKVKLAFYDREIKGLKLKFVTDENVLNNISDDMIYLRELVVLERKKGVNILKAAHLGRLVVVFVYNSMEAHRDFVARKLKFTEKCITWKKFFESDLRPYFEKILKSNGSSVEDIELKINGLLALRNFISHGLVDESAKEFDKKIGFLVASDLLKNPTHLKIEDIDSILSFDEMMTNLLGMATSLYCRENE